MSTKILHYFNPGHENAILNTHPSYTPPASQTEIMRELSSIPAWYGNQEDWVLVDQNFDEMYHQHLQKKGIILSNIIKYKNLDQLREPNVYIWGVTPRDLRFFEKINKELSIEAKLPEWDEIIIRYNSRFYARDILEQIINSSDCFETITLPQFFTDLENLELYHQNCLTKQLAKSPYSSAGRGLLWLPTTGITRTERQILQGMFNRQPAVSLEPVYDKVLDFAMEFMSDGKGNVTFEGYSLFNTNDKGSYSGNILISQEQIEENLSQYVTIGTLDWTKEKLQNLFSKDCGLIHKGCIGVDMMIYKEENTTKLHPCVEINMRYNMGYLSIKLQENHLHKDATGHFYIEFNKAGETFAKHCEMEVKYPLQMIGNRIRSGYISLCPVHEKTRYRAYILAE